MTFISFMPRLREEDMKIIRLIDSKFQSPLSEVKIVVPEELCLEEEEEGKRGEGKRERNNRGHKVQEKANWNVGLRDSQFARLMSISSSEIRGR